MIFHTATTSDFAIVKNIVHTTIQAIYPHYYPMGVVDFFLNHHSDKNILRGLDTETVLLLCVQGTFVGTGTAKGNEICRMFVLPEHQGLGYGTAIITELEKIIGRTHSQIRLDSSLPAFQMYLSRGYCSAKYEKIVTPNKDVLCFHVMEKSVGDAE